TLAVGALGASVPGSAWDRTLARLCLASGPAREAEPRGQCSQAEPGSQEDTAMTLQSLMHVRTTQDGVLSRRSFLRTLAAGAAGLGAFGWKDTLTLHADEMRKQGLACILLFMRGGPSQFETFDPKPGHANGGPTKAIPTAVSGIEVAENWPQTAKAMKDIAIVRSMTNKEGEHQRATYQMHTGYVP